MNKQITLVRGVSGCGKTTFSTLIDGATVSADDYFMVDGEYRFDGRKLKDAHAYCQETVETIMQSGANVVVANTFTRKWEMDAYFKLAEKYGYMVHTVIVENRHGGENVHNVPAEAINNMKERFEVIL
jgi:predicted kinase